MATCLSLWTALLSITTNSSSELPICKMQMSHLELKKTYILRRNMRIQYSSHTHSCLKHTCNSNIICTVYNTCILLNRHTIKSNGSALIWINILGAKCRNPTKVASLLLSHFLCRALIIASDKLFHCQCSQCKCVNKQYQANSFTISYDWNRIPDHLLSFK